MRLSLVFNSSLFTAYFTHQPINQGDTNMSFAQATGDLFWNIGKTIVDSVKAIGETVGDVATCKGSRVPEEVIEAGEELKHNADVLCAENDQLKEQIQNLKNKLDNIQADHSACSQSESEAADKLHEKMEEVRKELDEVTENAGQAMETAVENAKAQDEKLKEAAEALKSEKANSSKLEKDFKAMKKTVEDTAKAAAAKAVEMANEATEKIKVVEAQIQEFTNKSGDN